MHRVRKVGVAILGTALLVALASATSAGAQETTGGAGGGTSVKLQLTESRNSGVSGTATLKEVQNGLQVTLDMKGLPQAGIQHLNHFHTGGTCADDLAGNPAPPTIPLTTITAKEDGTGSATTTLSDTTLDQLFQRDQSRYIAFHAEQQGSALPPVIACADVDPNLLASATGVGKTSQPLPQSGGPSFGSSLLPGAALLLGSGILAYAVLWRRR